MTKGASSTFRQTKLKIFLSQKSECIEKILQYTHFKTIMLLTDGIFSSIINLQIFLLNVFYHLSVVVRKVYAKKHPRKLILLASFLGCITFLVYTHSEIWCVVLG